MTVRNAGQSTAGGRASGMKVSFGTRNSPKQTNPPLKAGPVCSGPYPATERRLSGRIREYLEKRARLEDRPVVSQSCENVEQVVVIPALAEKENLFGALDALAQNPAEDLQRTLVICVVNNRSAPFADAVDIKNNEETLAILDAGHRGERPPELAGTLDRGLRIAHIDASSPGRELPEKGGVGSARKIGLDWGLRVLSALRGDSGLLLSLDADTWVEPNYLPAVRAGFGRPNAWAAAISYAHRLEGDPSQVAAIVCYEIFLRYHVLGLAYAGSPYAFHSIGSAMACTAKAYVAVSGMNQRQAAEDFYFLQQLAKTGRVDTIASTTVHPSPRPSHRVPFGTGQRVRRFLDAMQDEYALYDPRCYEVIRAWLVHVSAHLQDDAPTLCDRAGSLSPSLRRFLDAQDFATAWPRLQRNAKDLVQLHTQFHRWFDGFKTLKLIHFLRDNEFPLRGMFESVAALLEWVGKPFPEDTAGMRDDISRQIGLLNHLRPL